MAELYPISSVTVERMREMPGAGGTHLWLAQVAAGVKVMLTPQSCFDFLRRCCDMFVSHRAIPDREIEAAVLLAYSDKPRDINFGRQALKWPEPDAGVIQKIFETVPPCFDGVTSTGLKPWDVLPSLFQPGELVCTGADSFRAVIRPLELLTDADFLQFIVVNPMRGLLAANQEGDPSVRCQNNVTVRRHIVAEFDDVALTKAHQAQLSTALGQMAPLVLAVDSGGKSVHAWFRVDAMSPQEQGRFFAVACLLGADRTRWDICGWLRMPGGLRPKDSGERVRQKILYFKPDATLDGGTLA